MLHGLLWLWLDEELSCEADLVLVGDCHLEEGAHVIQLSLQVRVEEGLVAFTSSPEHCSPGEGGGVVERRGEERGEGGGVGG